MNISIETTYYNCSFSLVDIKCDENNHFECLLNFNAGWLSCRRNFIFTKNHAVKFSKKLKKIDEPFGVVAVLENTTKNMKVEMECIGPDTIMVSAEGYDNSEFEQGARLGFNIKKAELEEFMTKFNTFLAQFS